MRVNPQQGATTEDSSCQESIKVYRFLVEARTACVAVCQGLFLAGLPGFDGAAVPACAGRVLWCAWLASVCAAAVQGLAKSPTSLGSTERDLGTPVLIWVMEMWIMQGKITKVIQVRKNSSLEKELKKTLSRFLQRRCKRLEF